MGTLDAANERSELVYATGRNDGVAHRRERVAPARASRPVAVNWVEEAAASDSEVKKNLAYYFKAYFSRDNVSLKDNLKDNFDCSAAVRETLFNHAAYVKSAMKVKSMANTTD